MGTFFDTDSLGTCDCFTVETIYLRNERQFLKEV